MTSPSLPIEEKRISNQQKGRIILVSIVLMFVIPAIAAKVILSQHWYQSGVTNKGVLIEPRTTYSMLGMEQPSQAIWHFGYVIPSNCGQNCQQQIHLLNQSYTALGKYKSRVNPVLYITHQSDRKVLTTLSTSFTKIEVTEGFSNTISPSAYLLVDPLGQLVMQYPQVAVEEALYQQHKELLTDFRKLLKLSRVG